MDRGTIALDIDGTITGDDHLIPDRVVSYLKELHTEGWQLMLITGRTFSFALKALEVIDFPFLLGVQNGADLLTMPERKIIGQSYFTKEVVRHLDALYEKKGEDFILYSGFEKGDFCYYRPRRFSSDMLAYLSKLKKLCSKPWQPVESFDIQDQDLFPLIKCFGLEQECRDLEKQLKERSSEIEMRMIRDPIDRSFYLLLVTHREANKGAAVKHFMKAFDLREPLITAGNDNNDIPLLSIGDMRISMEKAPDRLHELANIIAPSSIVGGIVEGLKEAIRRLK